MQPDYRIRSGYRTTRVHDLCRSLLNYVNDVFGEYYLEQDSASCSRMCRNSKTVAAYSRCLMQEYNYRKNNPLECEVTIK
jgi:hypothetical protein